MTHYALEYDREKRYEGFFIKVAEPLCFGLPGTVFKTKKLK
jgi:hypothetical protein